ncbi:CxxC motif protein [Haloarcula virus Hardyhisp2]|uniref:CxxC motif protein n=1 Tax=Haloarcula virus Hardyhisp2 TaxID=2811386 RepID=A0A898KBT3_9VIRU|nr:CxxC motif protein [Haloarcula virus Hardyhisp2]QSJ05039.1 CxxC motif protein [Haloarcula virus Hardyhisp2]
MYDQMTCPNCDFCPTCQTTNEENQHPFQSQRWNISRKMEYFPSKDEFQSWSEVRCPVCNTVVDSTL